MEELGFQNQNQNQNQVRLGYYGSPRDISPDSVIFTVDSNFTSLFSSASASVDRCSFASDLHDPDSLASDISQNLAVHDLPKTSTSTSTSSGPDSDPNKSTLYHNSNNNSYLSRKVDKPQVRKEGVEAETCINENQILDSARSSFSQALKECQDRRSRSEALLRKQDRRRPASLDLNNSMNAATSSSPRFGVMKKNSASTQRTGTFPSPGTPNCRHASAGIQKGWSSERVPLHTNASRRHLGAALLPLNNGRTLPSKWEDAERWIFSPVGGDSSVRPSFPQPQRRPKSKSGPLGPPGVAYNSMFSPATPMFEGGNGGNLMADSPFSAGVIVVDGLAFRCGGDLGGGGSFARVEPCMTRSVSIHGCSDQLMNRSALPGFQDEKPDNFKDAATDISRDVSRRDMATQMSPEGSPHSSPERRPSFSPSTSAVLPIVELQSIHSSPFEVRDVQVDERVTMTRWSKKHRARFSGKGSELVDDWKKKDVESRSCAWGISEAAKSISKANREDAKIAAWENLQKAKAEAAMRKLEMKLEKKRSLSMDKIMSKLRSAQRKAQAMRSSVLANQSHQVARTSHKAISFRKTRQINSLSGCFTCHAF